MKTPLRTLALTWILTIFPSLAAIAPARADEVTHWNRLATDAAAAVHTDPLTESRMFAMLQVAIHDAVNAAEPRYELYISTLPTTFRDGSAQAAAAVAAHDTLVDLLPSGRKQFDAALDESLRALGGSAATERGIAAGRAAARAVLDRRRDDGSARTVAFAPGTTAGAYRPTPPRLTPAWMAQWGGLTPFVLRSSSQFRPEPPPAMDGERARFDVGVVRSIGARDGSARTDEQSEIARFWYEMRTPPRAGVALRGRCPSPGISISTRTRACSRC